jgi:hypothetical protein
MPPRAALMERGLNLPKSSHKSPTEADMLVTFVVVKAEAQLVADCSVEPRRLGVKLFYPSIYAGVHKDNIGIVISIQGALILSICALH